MNMEDRLKEAFEQEAEHLHAPSGSPETAMRRGRRRRASNLIGGATLILTLVGGTAAGVQLLGTSDDPEPGDQVATQLSQAADESTTVQSSAGVADFVWEQVKLPMPEGAEVWNIQVAAGSDGFVAVGNGAFPDRDKGGNQILVWQSDDGTEWSLAATASPFNGPADTLLNAGDGFVAIVRSYDGSSDSTSLYSSTDGVTWTEGHADFGSIANNQYMWFAGAATGNGATVLAGVIQTEPDQPPIVLEKAGVTLQQNNRDGSFTVSDLTTGELITVVDAEVVYGESATDGATVYGADGEVIVVIPWEVFDEAGALPRTDGEQVTIERDGVRLDLFYDGYTFVATDIATGTVLASGDQDSLYRPPSILITHPDTGEVIVDITMDEFL